MIMKNTMLNTILTTKKTCYFISPHLDDAIFSAGALMTALANHTKIVVITIFTEAGKDRPTLSAKKFLEQCGYKNAPALFAARRKEDEASLRKLNSTPVHLGFSDALWRKKRETFLGQILPEIDHSYPTYRWHVIKGIISQDDKPMINEIKQKLQSIISEKDAFIFCPTGIGNHVDHVITSKICKDIFPNVIYWSDFPYNTHQTKSMQDFETFQVSENLSEKKKLMELYHSQYQAMFKNGVQLQPEEFFYKKI